MRRKHALQPVHTPLPRHPARLHASQWSNFAIRVCGGSIPSPLSRPPVSPRLSSSSLLLTSLSHRRLFRRAFKGISGTLQQEKSKFLYKVKNLCFLDKGE
jgi:hypothetical protein